ncbi:outer membrane beta-barrel protein [Winogradskyella poriferorum]|uniref:Outer membrane beta-barrel protein n=1 Tax=Winogradskyella poriferorum TaxID=307627 RepID=A0ABU7W6W6_9FLAO
MKKLFLAAFAVFAFASVNAQEFKAGISGGLPIGDAGDLATFAIAVDLGYLFDVSEDFQVGPAVGFQHNFGEEINGFELDDVQFVPVTAAGRYAVSEEFTLGADLGYAVGINDGNDGGFYYAPRAQYSVSDALDIVVAYRGVSADGGSWNVITAGVEFGL